MKAKFIYFDLHGIGIIPRLVLAAGGIKFEDNRVSGVVRFLSEQIEAR